MIESSSKQKEETWFVESTLMAILDFSSQVLVYFLSTLKALNNNAFWCQLLVTYFSNVLQRLARVVILYSYKRTLYRTYIVFLICIKHKKC